jgi:4-hydroxybenzoate polyprenyltransferase/phosphoserine phosphatase
MVNGMPEDSNLPLVVDLDGTLIKTDLLLELSNSYLKTNFLGFCKLVLWLIKGKTVLKTQLSKIALDARSLPYNLKLISWLKTQKISGRKIILATASHITLAHKVADHLDIFDEVFASDTTTNLKAAKKRNFLVKKFGDKGFDYVGNSHDDVIVWHSAAHAIVVSNNKILINKMKKQHNNLTIFNPDKPNVFFTCIKSLRPHQWLKNLLVIVPLFAAQLYNSETSLIAAFLAFITFSLTSSGIYVFNDLVDIDNDRQHERKKNRPFASGDLSIIIGWITWPLLVLTGFTLAYCTLPEKFLIIIAIYFVIALSYSLKLKQFIILDVIILAILYTLRIIAGTLAIEVALSFWLLAFSMFIFFSLALIKRFSELKALRIKGNKNKLHGRSYDPDDLEIIASLGAASGYISVLVLALYIQDHAAAQLYHRPEILWLSCPLLLYWVSFVWLIAHRGKMHDDPIVFAMKNSVSLIIACLFIGVFIIARVI